MTTTSPPPEHRHRPHPRLRRLLRRGGAGLAVLAVAVTVFSLAFNALTARRATVPAGLDYVPAGDVRTRIRTWGDPASGSTVVLVHGAAETADTWAGVAERLAVRHRVVALDLVGWGYSERVAPYDLDHQTRQLLATVHTLGLHRPVLVGHSSGAAPVAEAALREPGAVGGVLLLDGDALATGAGSQSPARFVLLPPWRTTALRLALGWDGLIRTVEHRQCGPGCARLDADGVDAWRRPLQVEGGEEALWSTVGAGGPGLSEERLAGVASLPVPKAVVFGTDDDVFPAGTPEQTAARIGAPPPTLIPQGRHLTMISHPDAVATAIADLATHAAR